MLKNVQLFGPPCTWFIPPTRVYISIGVAMASAVIFAKSDEPIEMRAIGEPRVGPRKRVSDGGHISAV